MFEVVSYIGRERHGAFPDYAAAAAEANRLSRENRQAYVINEIVRRCIVTPQKQAKTR